MGSIREREKGVFEVRVFAGRDPVTGRPRQISRTVRGGKREAKDRLRELETEAKAGRFAGSDVTVDRLLTDYFALLERKGHSPKTLHAYRNYAAVTISPAIGRRPVRKLTARDLDDLYETMVAAGRSPSTCRQIHAIMSGALGQAVKWEMAGANVARLASPPTVRAKRIVPPTATEVQAVIALGEQRDPILAALLMLAALTGARRGELCALRWSDVNLDVGTVRIARSMLDLPGRVEEKSTKSHAERTLALGEAGVALLTLHRRGVDERAGIGEATVARDAFVFSERLDGAAPVRPDKVTRFFSALRDDLALPHLHLHSLRHFVATELASRGDVSARTLAGRLGHADASVSLKVYAAFFPAADVEAADIMGHALGR